MGICSSTFCVRSYYNKLSTMEYKMLPFNQVNFRKYIFLTVWGKFICMYKFKKIASERKKEVENL